MAAATKYNAEEKIWSGPEYTFKNPTVSFGQSLLDKLELHGDKLMQVRSNVGRVRLTEGSSVGAVQCAYSFR